MTAPVNILLVDDQPRNLDVLEAVLSSPGYRLVRADSANAALLALLDEEFAAIVLDIKMPGMSGPELAQIIKQRERTRHIPILFLTAHTQDEADVLLAYDAGGVDYLNKPINPQVLRSKINVFADLFRKTHALAAANLALEAEILERQRAQEALRKANEDLEARVHERTADLTRINVSLAESEQRLRVALEGAIAVAYTWEIDDDQFRRYHSTDPTLSINPDEPQRLADVLARVHPEDRAAYSRRLYECLAGPDGRYKNEFRVIHPDASVHWLEEWGTFERGADGRPRRLTALSMDVTERKRITQALEQAKAEAEAANAAKDQFLAVLSHELRTPLTPVLVSVQLLEADGSLPEAVRESLTVIRRNVELEARLIDDLLDLTRVERGKLQLNLQDVDLNLVVRQAMEICSSEAAEKGVRIVLDSWAASSRTIGDPARLQQVFWNLIKNSVKFTPPGGEIRVLCANERVGEDDERLMVSIHDTGVGIDPAALPRVFDAFEQADRSIAQRFGGLGLGLAISKALVELHSGAIVAASPGRNAGSTFTVSLPAAARNDRLVSQPPLRPARLDTPDEQIPLHVLLVEDHADSARVLVRLLRKCGYIVTHACTKNAAVEFACDHEFDLLISDLGLPDGSGHDLIRELSARRAVRGIALSGFGMEADVVRSMEAGFLEHLTKPVTIEQLQAAIDRAAKTLITAVR